MQANPYMEAVGHSFELSPEYTPSHVPIVDWAENCKLYEEGVGPYIPINGNCDYEEEEKAKKYLSEFPI